ncbi:hypothetical protein BV378_03210 [Nostoc sp. RF31YmG]|nr:hypothetical protein BV378_03210 [Nostoc sp. RF31YmG]
MVAEHHIDLSIAREQMLQHILQIEDLAALQERKRIARDIHDSLGNALTTLNIQLQTAHKLWNLDPTLAEKFLAEAQRLGAIAIQEVRQSVSSMREIAPLEQTLTDLIDSLVQNFYQVTGILPSTNINLPVSLSTEVVKTLYRIIQEGLTNICKYAGATKVDINLSYTSSNLCLSIQDNGKGFSLLQNKTGFGLQGMQERVLALKGNCNIDTEPGYGCRITVNLPLEQQTVWEQSISEEDFNLKIVDKIPVEETSTTDSSLEIINKTPVAEVSATDSSLEIINKTPIEKTSTTDFSLEILEKTPVEETSTKDFSLEILEKTPVEETLAIDFSLKIADTTQLEEIYDKFTSSDFQPQLVLSPEEYNHLDNTLMEFAETIAPTFLKQVADQVSNSKDLVDNLKLNLAEQQHLELENTRMLFRESNPETEKNSDNLASDDCLISQCEQKLAELIGPIAHYLVQKVRQSSPNISHVELIKTVALEISDPKKVAQAFNYQEVIDKLSVHLVSDKQIVFKQQSSSVVSASLSQPEVKSKPENLPINLLGTDVLAITESFLHQCERELAEFIGPMAVFLVQKAVKSSLNISRKELIKILAAEIPDSGKAAQFQQRLHS